MQDFVAGKRFKDKMRGSEFGIWGLTCRVWSFKLQISEIQDLSFKSAPSIAPLK